MAAGLGFIEFSTGDVLSAAAANGYLASQTVMVFASAAARTSAIASPQEGMISFLKDTDTLQYYTGSAWSNVVSGSSSGLVFIQKGTFSASTAVNVNTCFSSTYDNYRILVKVTGASVANGELRLRMRSATTDNSTANYNYQRLYAQNTSVGGSAATNQTSAIMGPENTALSWNVTDMSSPFLAENTLYSTVSSYNQTHIDNFSGAHKVASSFDGFTMFPDAGTITGEVWVYGYAK